jgi:hypothetical protein
VTGGREARTRSGSEGGSEGAGGIQVPEMKNMMGGFEVVEEIL